MEVSKLNELLKGYDGVLVSIAGVDFQMIRHIFI